MERRNFFQVIFSLSFLKYFKPKIINIKSIDRDQIIKEYREYMFGPRQNCIITNIVIPKGY